MVLFSDLTKEGIDRWSFIPSDVANGIRFSFNFFFLSFFFPSFAVKGEAILIEMALKRESVF